MFVLALSEKNPYLSFKTLLLLRKDELTRANFWGQRVRHPPAVSCLLLALTPANFKDLKRQDPTTVNTGRTETTGEMPAVFLFCCCTIESLTEAAESPSYQGASHQWVSGTVDTQKWRGNFTSAKWRGKAHCWLLFFSQRWPQNKREKSFLQN